jgi:hypothetical protein
MKQELLLNGLIVMLMMLTGCASKDEEINDLRTDYAYESEVFDVPSRGGDIVVKAKSGEALLGDVYELMGDQKRLLTMQVADVDESGAYAIVDRQYIRENNHRSLYWRYIGDWFVISHPNFIKEELQVSIEPNSGESRALEVVVTYFHDFVVHKRTVRINQQDK